MFDFKVVAFSIELIESLDVFLVQSFSLCLHMSGYFNDIVFHILRLKIVFYMVGRVEFV